MAKSVSALEAAGLIPVTVVGGDQVATEALGYRFLADRFPGEGPLGGIITALSSLESPLIAVLAGDLPDPDPHALSVLVDAATDHDVVVPIVADQPQWLFSVWRRTALEHLQAAYDSAIRAPHRAVAGLRIAMPTASGPRFRDIDTRSEFDHEGRHQ